MAIPVAPDAETARQWARDELQQPIYHPREDPFTWLINKVTSFFSDFGNTSAGAHIGLWITAALLIAGLVILILRLGPMRHRSRLEAAATLDDTGVTAQELRTAARQAYTREDFHECLLFAFRAIVQDGIERTFITSQPGLTAREAAQQLTRAFPEHTAAIETSAHLFDATAYAAHHVLRDQAHHVAELMQTLARSTPRWQDNENYDAAALTFGAPQ